MTITVFPMTPHLGAEIGDIDLSQPLSPTDVEAVKQAFWQHAVLIFPDQHRTEQQHLEFAKYIQVMWDNRCCPHRGTEYDDLRWKRDMHRATVSDIANTCEQENIEVTAAAAV